MPINQQLAPSVGVDAIDFGVSFGHLQRLNKKEYTVFALLFGVEDESPRTIQDVARESGMDEVAVVQRIQSGLPKVLAAQLRLSRKIGNFDFSA